MRVGNKFRNHCIDNWRNFKESMSFAELAHDYETVSKNNGI